MYKSIQKRILILFVIQFLCGMAKASSLPLKPIGHATRIYYSEVIFSRSNLQELRILDMRIDTTLGIDQPVIPLFPNTRSVTRKTIYVHLISTSGRVSNARWRRTIGTGAYKGATWLAIDGHNVKPGDTLEIGSLTLVDQKDEYFVGAKRGIPPKDGVTDFSGCFKIALGLPFSTNHNDGVAVTAMGNPGRGFHGWCYRYRPVPGKTKYYLHYFSASSAPTWTGVASWYKKAFDSVAVQPSMIAPKIAKLLELQKKDLSNSRKIKRIEGWMKFQLHYSAWDTYAHIPQAFDRTIQNGFGDCKALSLVMVKLLHAAHIRAHIVLTSSEDPWVFIQNASNLNKLDHVAVYLPDTGQFFDPTVNTGTDLDGHQVMDISTDKIMKVPFGGAQRIGGGFISNLSKTATK